MPAGIDMIEYSVAVSQQYKPSYFLRSLLNDDKETGGQRVELSYRSYSNRSASYHNYGDGSKSVLQFPNFSTDDIFFFPITEEFIVQNQNLVTQQGWKSVYDRVDKSSTESQLIDEATNHLLNSIDNAEELQIGQFLRSGVIQVSDANGNVIGNHNYDRSTANLITSDPGTGVASWANTNADPGADFQLAIRTLENVAGASPTVCVMGTNAYQEFSKNINVKDSYDNRRQLLGHGVYESMKDFGRSVKYVGSLYEIDIFVYSDQINGSSIIDTNYVHFFNPNKQYETVIGVQQSVGAGMLYGAVDHRRAPELTRFFINDYESDDGSRRGIQLLSSPFFNPGHPNAYFSKRVLT